jgi:hypothetical protein
MEVDDFLEQNVEDEGVVVSPLIFVSRHFPDLISEGEEEGEVFIVA